jgi:hypothetical protein
MYSPKRVDRFYVPPSIWFSGCGGCFPGENLPGPKADSVPPSSIEIKDEWSYNFTPPCAFIRAHEQQLRVFETSRKRLLFLSLSVSGISSFVKTKINRIALVSCRRRGLTLRLFSVSFITQPSQFSLSSIQYVISNSFPHLSHSAYFRILETQHYVAFVKRTSIFVYEVGQWAV